MPTKYIYIQVKQDDINKGIVQDCHACPVARAITRYLDPTFVRGAKVRAHCLEILTCDGTLRQLDFPRVVMDWINIFDDTATMKRDSIKPFAFTLTLTERGAQDCFKQDHLLTQHPYEE